MGDSPNSRSKTERDPFYVGYLTLPRTIKKFIVPWLVGNIVLSLGIAAIIAQQHREPGDGTWDTGQAMTIEGELTIDPYPLLRTKDKTYILVEQGKIGVQPRIDREDIPPGKVKVTGYLIERDGRTVLELDGSLSNPIATQSTQEAISEAREILSERIQPGTGFLPWRMNQNDNGLGTHTLTGEIVDPKCYLGVMQPGDGKTHKVCATLCIKGGIPPMFLVRDQAGNTAAYLLTDAQGDAFPESHHHYIADPIQITGQVFRDGDLLILQADLDSIQRLGAGQ